MAVAAEAKLFERHRTKKLRAAQLSLEEPRTRCRPAQNARTARLSVSVSPWQHFLGCYLGVAYAALDFGQSYRSPFSYELRMGRWLRGYAEPAIGDAQRSRADTLGTHLIGLTDKAACLPKDGRPLTFDECSGVAQSARGPGQGNIGAKEIWQRGRSAHRF